MAACQCVGVLLALRQQRAGVDRALSVRAVVQAGEAAGLHVAIGAATHKEKWLYAVLFQTDGSRCSFFVSSTLVFLLFALSHISIGTFFFCHVNTLQGVTEHAILNLQSFDRHLDSIALRNSDLGPADRP